MGPESTGTRYVADLLSRHPEVDLGTVGHKDPFDRYWDTQELEDVWPVVARHRVIVTRRSIPSGATSGSAASYFTHPPLLNLIRGLRSKGVEVRLLITFRNPSACISSVANARQSAKRSHVSARKQLQWAYRYIAGLLVRFDDIEFSFFSLEDFLLNPRDAAASLFLEQSLSLTELSQPTKRSVNERHLEKLRNTRYTRKVSGNCCFGFTKDGAGVKYLGVGWRKPGSSCTETRSRFAIIHLPFPTNYGTGLSPKLEMFVVLAPCGIEFETQPRSVSLLANGASLVSLELHAKTTVKVTVPARDVQEDVLVLEFLTNAVKPRVPLETASDDRLVGFSIFEIKFNEVTALK